MKTSLAHLFALTTGISFMLAGYKLARWLDGFSYVAFLTFGGYLAILGLAFTFLGMLVYHDELRYNSRFRFESSVGKDSQYLGAFFFALTFIIGPLGFVFDKLMSLIML